MSPAPWLARGSRRGSVRSPMQLAAPPQVAISVGALVVPGMAPHHDLRLTTSRQAGRQAKSRHMIAAEGLAAVGRMIAAYRRSDRAATDYEIARVTVALRILRVMDDVWVRIPRRRLWTDVVRGAQPG